MNQNLQAPKEESPKKMLLNLAFNIVIPVFVLSKLGSEDKLGPLWSLGIALIFPLSYGLYDLIKEKHWNWISLLGLISVILTGGLAVLKLGGVWFALKEATIPAAIGLFLLFGPREKFDMIKLLIYNQKVLKIDLIEEIIGQRGFEKEKKLLLKRVGHLFTLSFFISAALNFFLAIFLLKSPPGTEAFNQELAKMTALSFPVIVLPSMIVLGGALYTMTRGLSSLTGLAFNDLMSDRLEQKQAKK